MLLVHRELQAKLLEEEQKANEKSNEKTEDNGRQSLHATFTDMLGQLHALEK